MFLMISSWTVKNLKHYSIYRCMVKNTENFHQIFEEPVSVIILHVVLVLLGQIVFSLPQMKVEGSLAT